eukprot:gene29238-36252_t
MAGNGNNRQQQNAPPTLSPQRPNPQTSLALGMDKMDEVALKRLKQQEYKNQLDRMAAPTDTLKVTTNRNNDSLHKQSQQQLAINNLPEQNFTNHNDAQRLYRERMNAKPAPSPQAQVYPESYKPLHSHTNKPQEVVGGGSGMLFGDNKDRELAAKKAKQAEYRRQLEQQTVPKQSLVQQHQNQQQQQHSNPKPEQQYQQQNGRNQPLPSHNQQPQYNPRSQQQPPDERYRQFSPRGADPYDNDQDEGPFDMERERAALREQQLRVEALRRVEAEYQRVLSPRGSGPQGGLREDFDHRGGPSNNRDAEYHQQQQQQQGLPRGGGGRDDSRDRDPRDGRDPRDHPRNGGGGGGPQYNPQHDQDRRQQPPLQRQEQYQQPQQQSQQGYEPSNRSSSVAQAQYSPTRPSQQVNENDRANDIKRQKLLENKAILDRQVAETKAKKEADKKREADEDKRRMDKYEAEKQVVLDAERVEKEKKKAIEKKELMDKQEKAEKDAFARKNRNNAPPPTVQPTSSAARPKSGSNPHNNSHGGNDPHGLPVDAHNPHHRESLSQEHDDYMRQTQQSQQYGHSQDHRQAPPQSQRDERGGGGGGDYGPDEVDPAMQTRMRARYDAEQRAKRDRVSGGGGNSEEEAWLRAQQEQREQERRWDMEFEREKQLEQQEALQHQQQQHQRRPHDHKRSAIETTGAHYIDAPYTTSPQKSPGNIARNRHVSDIYGSNPMMAAPVASGVPQGKNDWKPSGKQLSDRDRAGVAEQKAQLAQQMADKLAHKQAEKDREDAEDRKREAEWTKKIAAEQAIKDAEDAKRRGKVAPEAPKPVIAAPPIVTPKKEPPSGRRDSERDRDREQSNGYEASKPAYQHVHDDRHDPPPKVNGYPHSQSPDRAQYGGQSSGAKYGQHHHAARESEGINSPLKEALRNSHQPSHGGRQYEDDLRNSRDYPTPSHDTMDSFVSNYNQRMSEHGQSQNQGRQQQQGQGYGRRDDDRDYRNNGVRDSRDSRDGGYHDRDRDHQQQQRMQSIPERSRYDQAPPRGYNDRPQYRDEEEEEGSFLVQESTLVPINPYRNSDLLASLAPLGQQHGHSPPRKQQQSAMNSQNRYQSPAHQRPMDMEKSLAGFSAYEYLGRRTPNVEGRQTQQQQQQRPASTGRPRSNGGGAAAGTVTQRTTGAPY